MMKWKRNKRRIGILMTVLMVFSMMAMNERRNPVYAAATPVDINETNFPDEIFRGRLQSEVPVL